MVFTHELGHVLCGWLCGGNLINADLRPWRLPYSIFDPDPFPLVTLWGGPIIGIGIPILSAIAVRTSWARFIAFFCVLANGLYLAIAWVNGGSYLDTSKLLEHGAHPTAIVIYCLVTIGSGYVGFRRESIRVFSPRSASGQKTFGS